MADRREVHHGTSRRVHRVPLAASPGHTTTAYHASGSYDLLRAPRRPSGGANSMLRSQTIRGARSRTSSVTLLAGVGVSVVPMLILVLPAALGLPAVEPLLHESQFFPGFSRASLVAIPLAGLVIIDLAILAANRSMRSALVASLISSALALLLVLGAVGLVNYFNEVFVGLD